MEYHNSENAERVQAAQARHARRREQAGRERHQGTAAVLQQRYQSLHQQNISQHDEQDLKDDEYEKDSIYQITYKMENDDQATISNYKTKFNEKKTEYKEHKKEDTTSHHRHHSITETKSVYNDMKKNKYNDRQRNNKYQRNEW
eukprot:2362291-Amphidinium_carterae.2